MSVRYRKRTLDLLRQKAAMGDVVACEALVRLSLERQMMKSDRCPCHALAEPQGDGGWEPVDHACRFCGGRIVARGATRRCIHCETVTDGPVKIICGCGLAGGPRFYPFRCIANPHRGPGNPAVIVIARP